MPRQTPFLDILWLLFVCQLVHGYRHTAITNVMHLRDADNHLLSLCVVDIDKNSTFNVRPDVYHSFHAFSGDLCKRTSIPALNRTSDYLAFRYSDSCSINDQLKNFINRFESDHPLGVLISTPCSVNLTAKFNVSETVLVEALALNLSITVINDVMAKNLYLYNRLARIEARDTSVSVYPMLFLFILAASTVLIGSYWSGIVRYQIYLSSLNETLKVDSSDESVSKPKNNRKYQEEAFTHVTICSLTIMVSGMIIALLLLYFFYKYLIYFILFIFVLTTMIAVYVCSKALAEWLLPTGSIRRASFTVPAFLCCRETKLNFLDLILFVISIAIPIGWVVIRHQPNAWILQDFLGFTFCINMLRTLRLPSFQLCTYLLCVLFFYDIFFVFITPLITPGGKSIMVEAATGGHADNNFMEYRCEGKPVETLPMLFRVPRRLFGHDPYDFYDVCSWKIDSMLGYGDVMIPGLLIAYCAAFDRIMNIPYRLYHVVAFISYCLGLLITFAALVLMKGAAQPALLYLVPATIVPLIILSFCRKEFKAFWTGPEKQDKNQEQIDEIISN